jgi:hypothetical protein
MGPEHLTTDPDASTSGSRLGPRDCLRKGCGRRFSPRQWNQRYCREPECLREVKRWQAAKRQRQRRATPEGRQQHAEAERQRRQRDSAPAGRPERDHLAGAETAGETPAWSRSAKNLPEVFCDRPGCYEPPRESGRAPACYCGDACCGAVRQVRDRERKYLARKTQAGRLKRRLEYQAAKVQRCHSPPVRRRSSADPSLAKGSAPRSSVLLYGAVPAAFLDFSRCEEVPTNDSETTPGARPRAPPAP